MIMQNQAVTFDCALEIWTSSVTSFQKKKVWKEMFSTDYVQNKHSVFEVKKTDLA